MAPANYLKANALGFTTLQVKKLKTFILYLTKTMAALQKVFCHAVFIIYAV